MNENAKGQVVLETERRVEPVKLDELATALGTPTAAQTATLVPFFGPTVAGERAIAEALELDFAKALLAGLSYDWRRPFQSGETVQIRVLVEEVYRRGANWFGIVLCEFRGADGELVQQQRVTFVEREGA